MMIKYNIKYEISNFVDKIYLKLIKIEEIKYHISKSFLLFIKKINFYKISKKINFLIYKLKFSLSISRIYLIIFIIYLE